MLRNVNRMLKIVNRMLRNFNRTLTNLIICYISRKQHTRHPFYQLLET